MTDSVELTPWEHLSGQQQTELRVANGNYLDTQSLTCSLTTKIERFRQWLLIQGNVYPE